MHKTQRAIKYKNDYLLFLNLLVLGWVGFIKTLPSPHDVWERLQQTLGSGDRRWMDGFHEIHHEENYSKSKQ